MPLFKLIVIMGYTAYIAWWSPRLMSQLRYVEVDDNNVPESIVVDWFINKMMPRILWVIYLAMSHAMLTAEDNTTTFVYLILSLCASIFLLMKPHR